MKNLENINVQSLGINEIREINGGSKCGFCEFMDDVGDTISKAWNVFWGSYDKAINE